MSSSPSRLVPPTTREPNPRERLFIIGWGIFGAVVATALSLSYLPESFGWVRWLALPLGYSGVVGAIRLSSRPPVLW